MSAPALALVQPQEEFDVRCASCRRKIAVSDSDNPLRSKIYCNPWCRHEAPATPMEARNDRWAWMRAHGVSPVTIANIEGNVTHVLVYRTLAKR